MPTTSSLYCNSSLNDIGEISSSNKELRCRLPHATRIDKKFIVTETEVMCHCSRPCVVKTSWTRGHPGRRFYSCACVRREGCNYFSWIDDKFSEYVTFILNYLVGTIANLMEERSNHVDVDEVVKLRAENNLLRSTVANLYHEPKATKRRSFVLKLIVLIAIGWCIWVPTLSRSLYGTSICKGESLLYLNEERYAALTYMVASHGLDRS